MKHSNLHLPRNSSVAVPHIQRLIPNGRGSEKQPYDEWLELLSSYHKFMFFFMVSDSLRSTLIWSKLKNFPCSQTPLERYALYTHRNSARCSTPRCHTKTTLCMPPLLKTLDPPLCKEGSSYKGRSRGRVLLNSVPSSKNKRASSGQLSSCVL